jgi:hypothetical protein
LPARFEGHHIRVIVRAQRYRLATASSWGLSPEPDRRAAGHRRALHDDEPGALQCLHELLANDWKEAKKFERAVAPTLAQTAPLT